MKLFIITVIIIILEIPLSGCMNQYEGISSVSDSIQSEDSVSSDSRISKLPLTPTIMQEQVISNITSNEQIIDSQIISTLEQKIITVIPKEDRMAVLHNPDMGWVLYDNYVISKAESPAYFECPVFGNDFPGVDTVMLKFTWADIEKSEGVYDFDEMDFIYDYWKNRGKQISLGMSADSLLWYGSSGIGIPTYVIDRLPADKVQIRKYIDNSSLQYTVCDATEPYYLNRLKAFLSACDIHFKDSGRFMDYIDLRGYGLWGEWHQGYRYNSIGQRREALDDILHTWSDCFPDNWLALSYSYDPDEPQVNYTSTDHYSKYIEWSAFDLALKYPNITLRRDGAGGAVQNNERLLCDELFRKLQRGPFTSEGAGGYDSKAAAERILKDGLTLHPNYFTIIGWANEQARDFMEMEPDLFNNGLRTMGYRFVPKTVSYNSGIKPGDNFKVSSRWINRAVGRAVRNYDLRAILTDEEGRKMYEFFLGKTGCDKWIQGKEYEIVINAVIPASVKSGKYTFCIAFHDEQTNNYIQLPIITDCSGEGFFYDLGEIIIG